ncbi:MAG: ABC transporter substrate-binding protein [Acidimicrobiales bacterium]
MQHSSRRRIAAIGLAAALALAACGGTKKSDSASSGGTGGGSSSADSTKPTPGGTVTYGLEGVTKGFCLSDAQLAISGIQIARSVFDTLTVPDSSGTMKPFLAKTIDHSADYTTWTITLRDGVTFHNGSALDATVVKNNLDAFRGKYVMPDGKPRNAPLFTGVLADIADVQVKDPMTVVVTTTVPWVAFEGYLYSSGRLGMMAQAQLDDSTGCAQNMIGTGPFKLTAPISDFNEIDLVKNASYWQKDADGTQLPYLDKLIYKAIPEETVRESALESGDLQMMHTTQGETIAQLRTLKDDPRFTITENAKGTEVQHLLLNSSTPPFNNLHARRAVAYAFDSDKYNQLHNAGVQTRALSPFQEGEVGYLADPGLPTFDLQKAKDEAAAYQAETGIPLEFTYTTADDANARKGGSYVQQFGQDAGIKVNLASEPQDTLIVDAVTNKVQGFGWRNHPQGDPDYQYVWWHSGSLVNFGHITDPKLDALLEQGRSEPDPAKRKTIYEDLNKLFGEQVYNVWSFNALWTNGSAANVHGLYGPTLPDGSKPAENLPTGHSVAGLYISK